MSQTALVPGLNHTEEDERRFLEHVKVQIRSELARVHERLASRYSEMVDLKDYLQTNKADMDHVEKASVRHSADMMSSICEQGDAQERRLSKLLEAPYFGRIDINSVGDDRVRPTYIGIHSFYDPDADTYLVHDWRAPISSMFYEFELGDAHYDAPEGRIECTLTRKRQYRIEKQELIFLLETSLNIQDDILQKELSRASDEKMKNIVATIQRDQNAIIRNDPTHTLIIQGAAGSGKTSIALHRIAFLLYKYKDSIRSDEILIVSPNKVFSHYISQVLPELGEEMIQETTMEVLAAKLLDHKFKCQSFAEQVSALLEGGDPQYGERIKFKSTSEFLRKLDEYGRHVQSTTVRVTDLQVGLYKIKADWLATRFRHASRKSANEQIGDVLNAVVERMRDEFRKDLTGKERSIVRGDLKRMVKSTTLAALYKGFYVWVGEPKMFKPGKGNVYEHADVFPLIYLKMLTDGAREMNHIKHLVVDEMQDYTPVQYEVLSALYPCKKTILGDYNQSVSPLSSSPAEAIQAIVPESECMYMHKSYRSTIEIATLAQSIHLNPNLIPIERHGDKPSLIVLDRAHQELDRIRQMIQEFADSEHNSLGIVCKTQKLADALYEQVSDCEAEIRLLDAHSTTFSKGVMIATAYLAKGLEFDEVIVPFCDADGYRSVIDRHMLYVACTRAMHQLTLTCTGKPSRLLDDAIQNQEVLVRHE